MDTERWWKVDLVIFIRVDGVSCGREIAEVDSLGGRYEVESGDG